MSTLPYKTALIVGAGPGISASLARALAQAGLRVGLAARNPDKLSDLARESGAEPFPVDATDPASVASLFDRVDIRLGEPDLVVYNPSQRVRGSIAEVDPDQVRDALLVTAFGGFLVVQQAARRMLPRQRGAILLTGATASVKGMPQSTAFAMGKFAVRGMAQSLARELAPQNIHVAHAIIDGVIAGSGSQTAGSREDRWLDPDAIAAEYLHLHRQPRSAWTWEIELRPWVEPF